MNPAVGEAPGSSIEVRVDRTTAVPGRVWMSDRPRAVIAIFLWS